MSRSNFCEVKTTKKNTKEGGMHIQIHGHSVPQTRMKKFQCRGHSFCNHYINNIVLFCRHEGQYKFSDRCAIFLPKSDLKRTLGTQWPYHDSKVKGIEYESYLQKIS